MVDKNVVFSHSHRCYHRFANAFQRVLFYSWNERLIGQTTQTPALTCSENNLTITITDSPSSHSAWRSSSNCFLSFCNQNSSRNTSDCRLSLMPCFDYRTANNRSYCAPGSLCSLLEPCNNITGECSSNMSICVVNSCCIPQAVCLPLYLTNLCSSQNDISEFNQWSRLREMRWVNFANFYSSTVKKHKISF